MSAAHKVKSDRKDDGGEIYQHVPVHGRWYNGSSEREEGKDEGDEQESDRDAVDQHAVSAQAPTRGWKRFASVSLDHQAREGDDVGREERCDPEGRNGIECHRRADVDHREANRDQQGNHDCIERNVPAGFDL